MADRQSARMSKIIADGLSQSGSVRMLLYSGTHIATVGVKWLNNRSLGTVAGWDADRLYSGVRLPSARAVSVEVLSTSRVTPDETYSHMLMQWGQFIDHDVDFVPTAVAHARFSDGRHCNETCEASGPCFPIPVAADDPRVRRRRCIGFVRSSAMCGR